MIEVWLYAVVKSDENILREYIVKLANVLFAKVSDFEQRLQSHGEDTGIFPLEVKKAPEYPFDNDSSSCSLRSAGD